MWTDRQTDLNLTVAFCNFLNAPKKCLMIPGMELNNGLGWNKVCGYLMGITQ